MTEENKTIQTENKSSTDEAMLNADQTGQAQPPAVNPPAPPAPAPSSTEPIEQPAPTKPEIQEQTVPAEQEITPAQTKPEQAVKPEQQPQATVSEEINQTEQGQTDEKIAEPETASEIKTDKPAQPITPAAPAQNENNEAESFMIKFYNKLAELRIIANQKKKEKMQKNLDNIMEYARETQKVTNNDVERITKVKHAQSTKYLKMLVKQGLLVKFGKTKNTFYKPIKQ
ncbi:MAG: hypothetical protein Q8N21_04170 [bacterium]|nr:hypothetical protein [bacterium]